jgi:hypothetical protein
MAGMTDVKVLTQSEILNQKRENIIPLHYLHAKKHNNTQTFKNTA